MNAKAKFQEAANADEGTPKIKKLAWRLAINDCNLESEIKRAFDLAKSAGQELDLTFVAEPA